MLYIHVHACTCTCFLSNFFKEFLAILKENNKKFIEAYNSRDVTALGNIFAPDARIMPPNVPMMDPSGLSRSTWTNSSVILVIARWCFVLQACRSSWRPSSVADITASTSRRWRCSGLLGRPLWSERSFSSSRKKARRSGTSSKHRHYLYMHVFAIEVNVSSCSTQSSHPVEEDWWSVAHQGRLLELRPSRAQSMKSEDDTRQDSFDSQRF